MPVQNVCWSDPSSAYLPRFCSPLLIFSFPCPPSLFGGIVKIRAGFNHFLRSLVLRLSPVLSSPSACLWNSRTPAHRRAGLPLGQSSACAPHCAPLPPNIRRVPRDSRNASLRKGWAALRSFHKTFDNTLR